LSYNLDFYIKKFPNYNEEKVLEEFQKNLVKTNRDHKFFVDWKKVQQNAEKYKIELNLLNSLIGSNNLKDDFYELIKNYPEVLRVFPILIAIRDLNFPIIEDFSQDDINIIEYSFKINKGTQLIDDQIFNYYSFMEKTGIINLFSLIKDFYDYVVGVEVGMDTNARKNRGGKAMELLIEPLISDITKKYGIMILEQKKFDFIQKNYGLNIPEGLKNRRCDFILIKGSNYLNIEVNYYSGSGSKPEEIVDAYITRYNEIKKKRGYFIWITDGNVWKTSISQLDKGFRNLPYLLNIYFIRKGLLEEAIKEIFDKSDDGTINPFIKN